MFAFITHYALLLVLLASSFFLFSLFIFLHQLRLRQTQQLKQLRLQQLGKLREIIAGLQRHRGLSNGLLSGDASLQGDLDATRRKLDQQIQEAKKRVNSHQDSWNNLFDHWSRLREGRIQQAENNLAQHHLIIRNSIFLLQDLAINLDLTGEDSNLAFLTCIWQDVIQAAEWAGQARALGTGIAAAHKSSAEQRIRLRFLYHKIQELSGQAFATLQQSDLGRSFSLGRCQASVNQFLHCIEQDLLADEEPKTSARVYFQQATQAIDQLFSLVDSSLEALQTSART
ncbi:Nitrate and nitrite sensing [Marinospirillum celere]|uniref:Nitrate and nitrite sensing n=1 Tax=Marinospirillum celere TaxID=1122252 RepID=A0A1I1G3E7_9GAMM|nr:nitrate- and nitrite sensing domain-containing protein [Marinospirillum celere]SFC06369.1 Nitrate and nitrite sensing [Marinospirillum celere]